MLYEVITEVLPGGSIAWARRFELQGLQFEASVAVTTDGEIVLASTMGYGGGDKPPWCTRLTAVGDPGWGFVGWSGDATGTRITSYNVCYTKLLRNNQGVHVHIVLDIGKPFGQYQLVAVYPSVYVYFSLLNGGILLIRR